MNASEMISASDNNEILTVEHDLEVLSNNPGKYSDLSTEISAGGDVTLAHDYYNYDSGAPAITISGDNRVINGNGAVIDMDGSNNIRAFSVTGSGVTIKNLTIKNANYNGKGAAIYFDNLGTVENCNFIDNVASSEGGAIYFSYLGSSHEGNCKVKNCNFINNKVTGYGSGGAVYFPDVYGCAVENCNFTNNSAYYGGAIYFLSSSRGTVENCNFIDNFASTNGGAVLSDGDDLIFEKCNFINNTASWDGDAIYLVRGSVSVNDNWWGSNNPDFTKLIKGVTPSSYAVLTQSITPGSKATLNYAFYRNGTNDVVSLPSRPISLSTTGGQLDDDSGYLIDGRFSTKFGSDAAGDYEITAKVDNQTLKIPITVTSSSGTYSQLASEIGAGGNVVLAYDYYAYDSGAEAITISGDNRVINGNGAVIDMGGSNIRAFNVTGSGVTIKNLTIKNTHYEGDGGAVYFSSSGTVENCSFVNNSASKRGGAVYMNNDGSVVNCSFVNNTASTQGGAVFINVGSSSVVNCSFVNNSVTGNSASGGAILIATGSGSVVNCSFVNNSATGNYGGGGAVNIDGSVVNCSFVNNTASTQGGAVYMMSDGSVVNCSFVNNSVTGNRASGGAVCIGSAARSFSVVNCSFENNRGNYKNIYNSGRSLTLEDNKFLDTSITLNNTEFDYGTDFTVNGTVDVGVNVAIDDLIFKLNDTAVHTYTLDVSSDMKFSFDVGGTELDPGNYKITATNDVFNNAYTLTGSQIFTVKGDDPTPHPVLLPSKVTVPSRTSADYGTDVIIQATDLVNAYGIGAILLDSNGAKIRDLDVSGLNIFVDTDDLNVGTYNVLVYTLVDTTKYYSYSTYSALFINKGTAVVSVDIGDVEYGKPIDVSVDVLGGTGKVNVTVAGITKSSDLVNGSSKFTFDAITNPGKYDVDVVYYGDAKYDDFHTSKSIEVVAPSVIIADNIRRGVNSPYDYCATLLDANAKPIAGREITFTIAGKTLKATTDANGIAKVSAGLVLVDNAETVYDVVVTNPDTLENVTATTTIVPRLLIVSGDLTADYLENPPYVVQAIGDDANPVGEGETVNVVFAGFGYDMLTNATGHVVRTIGLAPGMYAVKACYKGYNTTATVFVVNQILKVTSGALKKTAKSYTLKATLKNSNGKAIAGKEVKLTFNGKTYNATTNSKGVASYKIGSKIIKKLKAGKTYTLQARYVNDIAKGKIKVEK